MRYFNVEIEICSLTSILHVNLHYESLSIAIIRQ